MRKHPELSCLALSYRSDILLREEEDEEEEEDDDDDEDDDDEETTRRRRWILHSSRFSGDGRFDTTGANAA